ncbi:MAG: OmpA family protein, partial [Opitutaceae bacterium]|nr:OmpA family protein [Cytophagales bacterium]
NSFQEAVLYFEKLEHQDIETKRKLGESYYNLKEYPKAENVYADIIKLPETIPSDLYRYASILNINKKYMESEIYMVYYQKQVKSDSRASEYFAEKSPLFTILNNKNDVTVKNLLMNTENTDFGGTYYRNKLIFSSSKPKNSLVKSTSNWNALPFLDLYVADIDKDGELNKLKPLPGKVNGKLHEASSAISPDGQTIFFTRNGYGSTSSDEANRLKLFYGKLNNEKVTEITPFKYNNNKYSMGQPSFGSDNNTLYFVSDMPGGVGGTDIYISKREAGIWSQPENLGHTINTEGNEMFPYFHKSNLLFFSSNGHTGIGGLDIFYSNKQETKWGKVHNIGLPLNSNRDDFAFISDTSMTTGYFSSDRDGGKGDDDIYFYRINKPFIQRGIHINLIVIDKENSNSLSGALVTSTDASGNIKEIITEDDGNVNFEGVYNQSYSIVVKHPQFRDEKVTIKNLKEDFEEKINLEKTNLELRGIIIDSKTKKPLEGARVSVTPTITEKSFVFYTDAYGTFVRDLGEKKSYEKSGFTVDIFKKGYVPITFQKDFQNGNRSTLYLKDSLNSPIAMEKIEVGQNLTEVLDMKPIYFDVKKFTISKDAAIELDKIVNILNDNPSMEIELGSHTDCHGNMLDNKILSEKRAKASVEYIQKNIKNPNRINGKGYGESKLKNECSCEGYRTSTCDETQHQENRRTEFIILKN